MIYLQLRYYDFFSFFLPMNVTEIDEKAYFIKLIWLNGSDKKNSKSNENVNVSGPVSINTNDHWVGRRRLSPYTLFT